MSFMPNLDKINEEMEKTVEDLANLEEFLPTSFKTVESQKMEYKQKLKEKFDANKTQNRLKETIQLIIDKLSYVAGPEASHKFEEELKNLPQNLESYSQKVANDNLSPEEAQYNYQRVLGFSDDSITAIYQLGCDYFAKREIEPAEKIFELLIYLCPEVASHWICDGLCLEQKKDLQGALVAFKIASDVNPDNVQGTLCYIRCLNELGQTAEAKTELENLEKFLANKNELKNDWERVIISLKNSIK